MPPQTTKTVMSDGDPATDPVVLDRVAVAIDGTIILREISWIIRPGERWAIVGPNGAGKTTLTRLLAGWLRTIDGTATILGRTVGRTDLRALRPLIGYASQSLTDLLRPTITPDDAVLAGANGALETWWHPDDPATRARAAQALYAFGVDRSMATRPWATLSAGERQRVLLARAMVADPALVVLDEPTAGLDIGGREDLVARLDRAATAATGALVLVTHHLEEIPPSFDRVALVCDGSIVAAGAATDMLRADRLSELYGVRLRIDRVGGRWRAVGEL